MEVIPGIEAIQGYEESTVVTIGMFDGVHKGHQRIIDVAHEQAREKGCRCVVITFDRHPLEIIRPGEHPRSLSSTAQKLRLMEERDVDTVLLIHFDESFANMTRQDFLQVVLLEKLKSKTVVIGENFFFGKGGKGDVGYLKNAGKNSELSVIPVPLLKRGKAPISSTRIRSLIEDGGIEEANKQLGWEYLLEGAVVKGSGIGAKLGFPTANLKCDENRCIPADGVYAGRAIIHSHEEHDAVAYIGNRPTIGSEFKTVEVHIPDYSQNLYDEYIGFSFKKRLRGSKKFKNTEELSGAIERDIGKARQLLESISPKSL